MFVLRQRSNVPPSGWEVKDLSQYKLLYKDTLPVFSLVDTNDNNIGYLIGYPIDIEKKILITDSHRIQISESSSAQELEQEIYRLGGRYIAIINWGGLMRAYLDAAGSLSLVYDAENNIIASTPGLIASSTGQKYPQEPVSDSEWYPAGLTPYKNIKRLLPNHYLDLTTWESKRHWPTQPFISNDPIDTLVDTIVRFSEASLLAVAKRYPLYLSITAGQDSRVLLALARQQLEKIKFFTLVKFGFSEDKQIAGIIAKRFGLNHSFLSIKKSSEVDKILWAECVGHSVGGEIENIYKTLDCLDKRSALLPGMCGEVARAYYWKSNDDAVVLDATQLLRRVELPTSKSFVDAMQSWLSGLDGFSTEEILELLYIEQRLGCWAGPQQYGTDPCCSLQLFVLAHRETFTAMLSLPHEYRNKENLAVDICKKLWPELLDYPFNKHIGTQKKIAMALRRPKRILMKLGLIATKL